MRPRRQRPRRKRRQATMRKPPLRRRRVRVQRGADGRSGEGTSEASLAPPRWAAGLGGIVAVGCWLGSGPSLPSDDRGVAARLGRWSGPAWSTRLAVMAAVVTVNDVPDGHVSLDVECLDRIYLNGYVPNLQVGAQVASFMTAHLGYPIPSPAIMEKMGTAFRKAVDRLAVRN